MDWIKGLYLVIGFIFLLIVGFIETFAANPNQLFVSTPTHAEAYHLYNNGTLVFQHNTATNYSCNSTWEGSIYYNGTDHYACDGTSWESITAAGAGGTDDQTLSYDAGTDVISIEDGNSIDITEVDTDTTCDGSSCSIANTGTLDGYEAAALLDDTNTQCDDQVCNLTDDVAYKFTNLDFTGTTGFSDFTDNEGSGGGGQWDISTSNYLYNNSGVLNWNETKGDGRYVTTESDPLWAANYSGYNKSSWDAAYAWGDHSLAGYLTSFTESDPLWAANASLVVYTADTSAWDKNAADDFDGAWSSLTGVPAGFADNIDNDTDTTLSEDEVEAYIFDTDNTANLGMNNYNITSVQCITFQSGGQICTG